MSDYSWRYQDCCEKLQAAEARAAKAESERDEWQSRAMGMFFRLPKDCTGSEVQEARDNYKSLQAQADALTKERDAYHQDWLKDTKLKAAEARCERYESIAREHIAGRACEYCRRIIAIAEQALADGEVRT